MKRNMLREVAVITTDDENMECLLDALYMNGFIAIQTDTLLLQK